MNSYTFTKKLYYLMLVLPFTILASGFNSSPTLQAQDSNQVRLEQFDLVTDTSGWVLLDKHLFWTSDAGQTWSEIGPSIPTDTSVEDVEFIDSNIGWMLLTTVNPEVARFSSLLKQWMVVTPGRHAHCHFSSRVRSHLLSKEQKWGGSMRRLAGSQ